MNYLFFILIIYSIIIEINLIHKAEINLQHTESISKNSNQKKSPDIFYIIMDSYTSSESLKKYWNYDNSAFEAGLKNLGFFISSKSTSKYTGTPFSIAASLNMSYLNLDTTVNSSSEANFNICNLIRHNRLTEYLLKQDYQIVNLSIFDIEDKNKYYFFNGWFSESSILARTLFDVILVHSAERNFSNNSHRIIEELKQIKNLKTNKPKFVYAHFMMPHYPYYFNKDGNLMPVNYSGTLGIIEKILTDKNKYLGQLIYTNNVIGSTVANILSERTIMPIIIIQGDHGFRFLPKTKDRAKEAHTIFNAYYFPDGNYSLLNDSIDPVNSFKIVLNKYFDTKIEMKY